MITLLYCNLFIYKKARSLVCERARWSGLNVVNDVQDDRQDEERAECPNRQECHEGTLHVAVKHRGRILDSTEHAGDQVGDGAEECGTPNPPQVSDELHVFPFLRVRCWKERV